MSIPSDSGIPIDGSPLCVSEAEMRRHLESLGVAEYVEVTLQYSPEQYYFEWNGQTVPAAATYFFPSGGGETHGVITFYPVMADRSKEEILKVLTHEYGHAIWSQSLSKGDQSQWKKMYSEAMKTGRFVTNYASRNVQEFFAECFEYYVHHSSTLRSVSPSCYRWLSGKVFRGRVFDAG
jgi:hypothetical protein